ncbi:MAG: hypothetical protein WD926_00030 [Patescibacteria group bacterium]
MIEQIEGTIRFDCEYTWEAPEKVDGATYKKNRIESLEEQIPRYREEHDAEVRRAAERTQWLKDLRESLGISESAPVS